MKRLRRAGIFLFLVVILMSQALGAETDRSFLFELAIDGSDTREVEQGDLITVVFTLRRTDAQEDWDMYAIQNQIRYDSSFFELVEGSALLAPGVQTQDLGLRDQHREFYMNCLSMTGGETWKPNTLVGSFQLKVIGTGGVTKITNENYLVSNRDGSAAYESTCQDVTVILSRDCAVTYETGEGSPLAPVTAAYGELLLPPEAPSREGYTFAGWYRDLDLQKPWDFDQDLVEGNMTLYAAWERELPPEDAPQEAAPRTLSPWLLLIPAALAAGAAGYLYRKKKQKRENEK